MKLIGLSGSLRAASYNTTLLKAAGQYLPQDATLELLNIGDIPLYNEDIDGESKPEPVLRAKKQVAEADGLLIATPEYNYSVPGGLKNAIDWLSRPAFKSVLAHKPVAVMSASMAPTGGARAQGHLKLVLGGTLSVLYPAPEFVLGSAHNAFDDDGKLQEENTAARLARFIRDYCQWLEALRNTAGD